MSRADRIAALRAAAERAFRPGGVEDAPEPLVEWIPASAPVMRQVRSDLERLAAQSDTEPELRRRLNEVLSGQAKLSSLLQPGGFPVMKKSDLPADAREVIDAIGEGEL